MPLFDDFDNKMNEKGKALHWKRFERFEGSTLHKLFVSEIKKILNRKNINSSIAGMNIIEKLRESNPDAYQGHLRKWIGGLFGMSLWNIMAKQEDEWTFRRLNKKERGSPGQLYRRKQND